MFQVILIGEPVLRFKSSEDKVPNMGWKTNVIATIYCLRLDYKSFLSCSFFYVSSSQTRIALKRIMDATCL